MNHLLDWCDGQFDIRSISVIGSSIVCFDQYVLQALQVFVECKFHILDDFQRSLFIIICKGCELSELFGNGCVSFFVRRYFCCIAVDADYRLESFGMEWFEETIVKSSSFQLVGNTAVVGCHGNHFHIAMVQMSDYLHTVHLRHFDIHEHDGWLFVV